MENRAIDQAAPDRAELEAFIRDGDQYAFQALVEKYRRLAFSAALRRCGQRELAEEATQNAFAVLARKARQLRRHPTLSGWIHRTAVLEASTMIRAEKTRLRKHAELIEREKLSAQADYGEGAVPAELLDDALGRLGARDRDVIMMRFYEGMSFAEIAGRLDQSVAACQKRSTRAVERLSRLIKRQGASTTGATAIITAISSRMADAAPAATSASISETAVATASKITTLGLITNTLHTMNSSKTIIAAAVTLTLLVPIALQSSESSRLEREIRLATGKLARLEQQQARLDSSQLPVGEESLLTALEPRSAPTAKDIAVIPGRERDEEPATAIARSVGKLKKDEIFYRRKYAEGAPTAEDPGYAEYLSEMDAFMRSLASHMAVAAEHEQNMDLGSAVAQARFIREVLQQSLDLPDEQASRIEMTIAGGLQQNWEVVRRARPDDPELLREWERANAEVMGTIWDQVHKQLTPEQQQGLEYGFSRHSVMQRSFNIGFPGTNRL